MALVNIDFEKAFDRVSHPYLFAVLKRCGLPDSFVHAISVLYRDASFTIRVNGALTDRVPFRGGIRQGCPLSGQLFVLSIEPLCSLLRERLSQQIGPLHYRHCNGTYADDLTPVARSDADFVTIRLCLDIYCSASGARVNFTKSHGLWCGSWKTRNDTPLGLTWTSTGLKFLGVHLGNSPAYQATNWTDLDDRLSRALSPWYRLRPFCSLFGRILIANQLAASVLWHRVKILDPPTDVVARWQSTLVKFVWTGLHWTSSATLQRPKAHGGASLVNIKAKIRSFRIQTTADLLCHLDLQRPDHDTAVALISQLFPGYHDVHHVLLTNASSQSLPPYYHSLFRAWNSVTFGFHFIGCSAGALSRTPLFGNAGLLDTNNAVLSPVCYRRFVANGRRTVGDLVDPVSRRWLPINTLLDTTSPTRLDVKNHRSVQNLLATRYPYLFDASGVLPGYSFGDSPGPGLYLLDPQRNGSRLDLSGFSATRQVYAFLLQCNAVPLEPLCPVDIQANSLSYTRIWSLNRLSPRSSPRQLSIHWLLLHGSLPAPNRLFHAVPDIVHPHCPFCPAAGSVTHMYLHCPVTRAVISRSLDVVFQLRGHNHHVNEYWWLVHGANHQLCNFALILLKNVIYSLMSDLQSVSLATRDVAGWIEHITQTFRSRLLNHLRLDYNANPNGDTFTNRWGVPFTNVPVR